jgi:pyruvate dehydrogenase E1 component beta subunit
MPPGLTTLGDKNVPRKSYIDAIREALAEELRRDSSVMVMGEDVRIGVFAGTRGLHAEFGDARIVDTPISELAIAGTAVGAAATGIRPVIDFMFGTFMYLAFDQIANQAGAMRYMFGGQATLPIVFMAQNGSGISVGHHHSQTMHQYFMQVPGIKVVAPCTPFDAKGLLKSAIRDNNPVVFFNHLSLGGFRGEIPDGEYVIPLGVGDVKRAGGDVTICAAGLMVHHALKAATELAAEGIEVEVIDPRTLSPWDETLVLESVAKTGRFVAVDEGHLLCGAASEWAATVAEKAFSDLKAPVQRVTAAAVPIPVSPVLERAAVPSAADIIAAVHRTLKADARVA